MNSQGLKCLLLSSVPNIAWLDIGMNNVSLQFCLNFPSFVANKQIRLNIDHEKCSIVHTVDYRSPIARNRELIGYLMEPQVVDYICTSDLKLFNNLPKILFAYCPILFCTTNKIIRILLGFHLQRKNILGLTPC